MNQKNIEALYPVSPQQQGMLFESIAGEGSGIHIEQELHTLPGSLNHAAFERAWRSIVARHAVLRTAFVWKDQKAPLQVVFADVAVPIEREDWRGLPAAEQQLRMQAYLAATRRQGFEMGRAPLMRLALFQVSDMAHRFVWTQHHILMDGWCLPVIVGEFVSLYGAYCSGAEPSLPPVRPYADYLRWLRKQDLAEAARYWQAALAGIHAPTALGKPATSVPPQPAAHEQYGEVDLRVPTPQALQSRVRQHRITLSTVLQGLWALLLARYSGEGEVVFGTTVSGRPAELEGAESMIGLFINTLPLRVSVPPNAGFWPWLRDLQALHAGMRRYEHCSSGMVHQWSGLPGAVPLYESMLVFENYPTGASPGEPSGASGFSFSGARTSRALSLVIMAGEAVLVRAIHDRWRVDGAAAGAMLEHLGRLLEAGAADEAATVGGLMERIASREIPAVYPREVQAAARGSAMPQTPLERMVAGIFCEVLGIEAVGLHDHFFALGGHSLLATKLMSRLNASCQVELPLRALFELPTVAGLAAEVDRELVRQVESLDDEEVERLVNLNDGLDREDRAPVQNISGGAT